MLSSDEFMDEIEFWFIIQPKPDSPPESVKEEEKPLAKDKATKVHLESEILPGNTKRKSSINLYQSVDDDHPDLQSIQNIVANMTFSADWISLGHYDLLAEIFSLLLFLSFYLFMQRNYIHNNHNVVKKHALCKYCEMQKDRSGWTGKLYPIFPGCDRARYKKFYSAEQQIS